LKVRKEEIDEEKIREVIISSMQEHFDGDKEGIEKPLKIQEEKLP
jgi:hypothetical protein